MIQRSAEIGLIFDASQDRNGAYNANATAIHLDQDGMYRPDGSPPGKQWNYFVTKSGMDTTQALYINNNDQNSDGSCAFDIRFRHNRNDTANVLFVDGHCGSFRLRQNVNSDIKMSNFYVDTAN